MTTIFRITIDTNCINARGGIPALNTLENLAKQGLIEITSTRVLPQELATDEKRILSQSKALLSQMGLRVMSPDDALKTVNEKMKSG